MRIVHLTNTLDPAAGGPPAVVTRLAAAQAALGHDVTIGCGRHDGVEAAMAKAWGGVPGLNRVRISMYRNQSRSDRVFCGPARKHIPGLIRAADIVHLHEVWYPWLLVAADAACRAGVPFCWAPHGTLGAQHMLHKRLKKILGWRVAYRRRFNRASFVHALNEEEMQLGARLGVTIPSRKVTNGIFLEEVEPLPPKGTFRRAHPQLGDDPYILFLARLHFTKGLDILAEAMEQVAAANPKVRLVVAGPDGGYRGEFESRIAKAGLTSRVHIVGPLYGEHKFGAYQDAACYCLPSRMEGFSMAVLEALACGTPVVISRESNFPEVEPAGAGRVVALNPADFARALIDVLSDEQRRAKMGATGRALIESRYTWHRIANLTIECYREFVRTPANADATAAR